MTLDDDLLLAIEAVIDDCRTTGAKVNTFAALQQWFPTNPLLWNACRHTIAAGQCNTADELEKAIWYLQQELKRCKPSS